jgi:hypothetical protein
LYKRLAALYLLFVQRLIKQINLTKPVCFCKLVTSTIEKNLSGVYSDDIFKEQNKLLEEKIKGIQAAKNDSIIEKYNLEAITKFIQNKFKDLNGTFTESGLEHKRVLMCSIFPKGLHWAYPGYSNTEISPFYRSFLELQGPKVRIGAPMQTLR